jgi:hypothetical protein
MLPPLQVPPGLCYRILSDSLHDDLFAVRDTRSLRLSSRPLTQLPAGTRVAADFTGGAAAANTPAPAAGPRMVQEITCPTRYGP